MSDEQPQNRTLKRVGVGAGVIAIAVVALGIAVRSGADTELAKTTADAATPTVAVMRPDGAPASDVSDAKSDNARGLVLPGTIQAFNSAPIYARTNGYVRKWLVDIGDSVREGQRLAILDAPEVDQQLAQARADYQTALAQQKLAQSTSTRWSSMLEKDAVSKQEADEKAGDFAAKSAIANAQLANVKRLTALQGFSQIVAPFSGVVTSRSAQIGALVTSGNASAQPLFTVSDVHRMRIYVRVPQATSGQIKPGLHATMTLPEYPGRSFDAVMTRSAGAVDTQSGTMLIELQADNPDKALKPGGFAQVTLPVAGTHGSVRVPSSALIFRESGPMIGIVDGRGKVTVKPVSIGRDEGQVVEIVSGLTGHEQVIVTPPDALDTGDTVRVESANAKK
ncbi:efflux RND transporter periplasmic adaptor subunit [Sphingobium nicotianae]|uniref:Efflux RND transporter periplasmic adaptor subunit n=1 Tax=Sphingobium nicotianae TaxID=2782607 RepID=A0A9X1DGG5_9SPHN|nr:efflux RND transporter periplasmic adaptor subunit [Sphingobium nicotianae]MBT2189456.1 efflux RND transporter periplasmic adaptor subunit [Sphingobium nicotianae]